MNARQELRAEQYRNSTGAGQVHLETRQRTGAWLAAILLAPFTLGASLVLFPIAAEKEIKRWRAGLRAS